MHREIKAKCFVNERVTSTPVSLFHQRTFPWDLTLTAVDTEIAQRGPTGLFCCGFIKQGAKVQHDRFLRQGR